jgi:short-subunit dehydrogenase
MHTRVAASKAGLNGLTFALARELGPDGITVNAFSVLAPAALIALLTVSLNVLADAFARTLGTSLDVGALRR